jgi:putative RNA 2'-phosphotransferase
MSNDKKQKKLAKFLDYVLGRRPDEFGLFPDADGFVKTKELLKALWEEGQRHVRLAHLKEIILVLPKAPIEIDDNKIRAIGRSHLPRSRPAMEMPNLLYTCVRHRAYPNVAEKGLVASDGGIIKLAVDKSMAQRIGMRSDAKPVLLTVHTEKAIIRGGIFLTAGIGLFTTDRLDTGCFSGPPLPKEKPPPEKKKAVPEVIEKPSTAGSFFPDAARTSKRSTPSWAKQATEKGGGGEKGQKKHKRQRERPPWRQ